MQPGAAAMLRGAHARPQLGRASSRRRAERGAEWRTRTGPNLSSSLRPSSQAARPRVALAAAPEVYLPLPSDVVAQGAEAVDRHLRSAARRTSSAAASSSTTAPPPPTISGVQVDVWWGDAEPRAPGCYDLSGVVAAVEAAAQRGLKARVALHFHGGYSWEEEEQEEVEGRASDGQAAATSSGAGGSNNSPSQPSSRRSAASPRRRRRKYHPLPAWVLAVGAANPDIFFRDAHGGTSERECLTLGVDDVPALAGRTATEAYAGLARALASALAAKGLWGTACRDVVVGLGPGGELRYPSHPPPPEEAEDDGASGTASSRWAYPCVGEFQCYDRYLLASLAAAAQERGQPHWGGAGPHDAVGGYGAASPAQLGFFHPQGGSWSSEYGSFFLEWYGRQLVGHACRVLDAVAGATAGVVVVGASGGAAPPPRLHARLPAVHWWHGSPERSAELTAGYYAPPGAPGGGEPYLDAMLALARRGVGVELGVVAPVSCCEGGGGGASSSSPDSFFSLRHPHPHAAADDPWGLLRQQRGTAAAVGVPALTLVARPRGLGAGAAPGGALGEAETRAALDALAVCASAPAEYRGVELMQPDALSVDGAFADLWLDAGAEEEEEEVVVVEEAEALAFASSPAAAHAAAADALLSPPLALALAEEEEDPAAFFDHHDHAAHQARNAYGVPAELIAQHRAALEQRRRQLLEQQQQQRQQQEQRQRQGEPVRA